jgi:signal transduction histidine kinase
MRTMHREPEAYNRGALGDDRVWKLFDELPTAAYAWRARGDDLVLVAHNAAAVTTSGGRAPAWLGTLATGVYVDEPEILADLRRVAADRSMFGREMTYSPPDQQGASFRIRVTYAAMPPDLVVVHLLDVTDEETLQEDLRRSAAEISRLISERVRAERDAEDAAAEERRRLATELHDHAIQSMTAAGLRLDVLRSRADGETAAALEEIGELVAESIARLRDLTAES